MRKKVLDVCFSFENHQSRFSFFLSLKEQQQLFEKLPELKNIETIELEERLIALSLLQFENLKEILLMYPKILLLDACTLSEKITKLLKQHQDIILVQQAFIMDYQNKE